MVFDALSGTNTSKQVTSVECIAWGKDGGCLEFRREFLITTTYNYAFFGTFGTAAECGAAKARARASGATCNRVYVPVSYSSISFVMI